MVFRRSSGAKDLHRYMRYIITSDMVTSRVYCIWIEERHEGRAQPISDILAAFEAPIGT